LIKNLEVDKYEGEENKELQAKDTNSNKLEKVQIKYSHSEDYIRTYYSLFLIESKSQIARSKVIEVY
jgi:hypothetical protein